MAMAYNPVIGSPAAPTAHDVRTSLPGGRAGGGKSGGGFSFADLIDVINPLQHIPIVSSIYRRLTGDEMNAPARIAGGALFGGVIGLAVSVADTVVDKLTGSDTGDHVMNAMLGKGRPAAPATGLAVAPASGPVHGHVTVKPVGHLSAPLPVVNKTSGPAPAPLDPATFGALADILGSAAPLAHLAPIDAALAQKPDKAARPR